MGRRNEKGQAVSKSKGTVAFIHPDLGMRGAERLIVVAAIGLQNEGYKVRIFTCYHNPEHAFPETTNGSLQVVRVGHWIPRSIFGRGIAVMAYLKMIIAAFYIHLFSFFSPDIIVCDQVTACIPVLKLPRFYRRSPQVLFYCHYPDHLLTNRKTWLKALYRKPIDFFEEITTNFADTIVVNSKFTRGVFHNTFKRIRTVPNVLYPSINSKMFDDFMKNGTKVSLKVPHKKFTFVSLNRFEKKKNIALAIRAMTKLKSCLTGALGDLWNECHLVVAGGYDPRLDESVECFEELKKIVDQQGLQDHVTVLLSPKDAEKVVLLSKCTALIYTPSEEHFGIVPLEAMYLGKPVIAVDSGGPRETVVDSETGFLCPATEIHFGVAMARLVRNQKLAEDFGRSGHSRFKSFFSFEAFSKAWDKSIQNLMNRISQSETDRKLHRD